MLQHIDVSNIRALVCDDERGGTGLERPDADLAGIDRRIVDGAALVPFAGDQPVLVVQDEEKELLRGAVARERPAAIHDLVVAVEVRGDAVGDGCPSEADTERLCNFESSDGGLTESGDGAQPVRVCGDDAGG